MEGTRRRALIAGVIGMIGAVLGVAGAGHAYLREWRRAIAWFALALGIGLVLVSVFTDPATTSPTEMPPEVTVPLLVVLVISAIDAYAVARRQDDRSEPDPDGTVSCPNCGKDIDPSLDFCHWCTDRLEVNAKE